MPEILNVNSGNTPPALFLEVADVVRKAAKLRAELAIAPDSRLVEDLGIDSLDLVGVLLEIQDHFDILIEDEDIVKLASVRDVAHYVRARRSAAAA